MHLDFLVKGMMLGFAIAAPVGPIGILCIRRTLQYGRFSGLFSGLGAAVADTMYAVIAAFGISVVSNFLLDWEFWFRLIGALFLLYLGWKTWAKKPAEESKSVSHTTLLGDFASTFFLTIANPMTILAFLAIFAALGLPTMHEDSTQAIELVVGVFLGSATWWLLLSEGITLLRKKVGHNAMAWINRIAGFIIAGFGVALLVGVFNDCF